ncbi:WXG100 family type VII secretion target [Kitasatospora phosalacinea]|uniref:WXG100 family type VII secretion target n=1 Tax=Kitasatospora phosalacinea TaxID=2065 RepID=UPI00365BE383
MSNDEQARRYVEAETPAEPAFTARLMPEEPVAPVPFRVGTVVPESIPAQPLLRATEETPVQPFQRAAESVPLQPFQRGTLAEPLQPRLGETPVEPLQPLLRATEGTPVQPFQREAEATAPLQPAHVMGRPLEQGEAEATAPLQPAHVMGRPMEQGVPKSAARTPAAKERGATGGAGTGFQVDPEQYRAAVSPMLAASEQVSSLNRSLSAFLTSLEAQNPWGNDESGKKFAEGEKGYLQYSHDTLAVLKGLPDELKYIADGLKAMAAGYENADEDVTAELGGIESTVQMPTAPSLPSTPVHPIISTRPVQSGRH